MNLPSDEPIRVARVIARTNVGGPALQITALMRGINEPEFHQILFRGTVADGEADYLEMRAPDVVSTVVPGLRPSLKPFGDIRALWFLVRAFQTYRPTVVHTHTAKAGVLGRLAAILTGVPVRVHTFHGHLLGGYFSPPITRLVVLLERLFARFTTHIVAVGDQVLADLTQAQIAQPTRSSVIAPGVRKLEPVDRTEASRNLSLEDFSGVNVVFVGRLTKIKRAERFIDMARRLLGEGVDARFIVVGDGFERSQLELRAQGSPQILFAGWQGDMSAVYATADLIVLTSDNEGMPVALIEAAMQCVPAVATDVGAVRQVVLDQTSGYVVAVDDAAALTDAVRRLCLDSELRDAMGKAAASHALRHFGEERLVAEHRSLYRELVNRLVRKPGSGSAAQTPTPR